MAEVKTIRPDNIRNIFYHGIGGGFLFLNKIRHSLEGYKTPRPFPTTEIERAVQYDCKVVEEWLAQLKEYKGDSALKGKSILELGPGADLGVGLILLAKGAKKYNAIDRHSLIQSAPKEFYVGLFEHLKETGHTKQEVNALKSELDLTLQGNNGRLNHVCRKDFDISIFEGEDIDLVFSQAAFEHFDDLDKVFSQLRKVVKSGGTLVAEVDLQTHTRWIRDADPLNIYRYRDYPYDLLKFPGSPNRVRPYEYQEILERSGWKDVHIDALLVLDGDYMSKVQNSLSERFRDSLNQMHILSMMICATKE